MIKLNKELCYKTIINERGSPITTAVIILEEIVNNYQLQLVTDSNNPKIKTLSSPLNNGLVTSYKYFEETLSFKRYKARYALCKLAEYSLISRERAFDRLNSDNKRGGSEIRLVLNLKYIQPLLKF